MEHFAQFVLMAWLAAGEPRDLVRLEMVTGAKEGCGPAKLDFRRAYPDGTVSAEVFRVPAGRMLRVMEVDWQYFHAPGLVQILALVVENRENAEKRNTAFESTIRLGPDGAGGASERMMTGFLVSSAARLCVETRNGAIGSLLRVSKVLIRGYLVNEE